MARTDVPGVMTDKPQLGDALYRIKATEELYERIAKETELMPLAAHGGHCTCAALSPEIQKQLGDQLLAHFSGLFDRLAEMGRTG